MGLVLGCGRQFENCGLLSNNRSAFMVGNGRSVKFWKDTCCGGRPLNTSFPSLFAIAECKDALVRNCWSGPEEGTCWNSRSTFFGVVALAPIFLFL